VGARLVYSSGSWEDVIYRDELERLSAGANGLQVFHTLTRSQAPGWTGYTRRVDGATPSKVAWPASSTATAFVSGPTPFVESVACALVLLGYPATSVKTERFGPPGGQMEGSEMRTDGNPIAGVLQEVFVREVTTGRVACAGCGKVEPIGAEHAYRQAPGIVLRCRHCDDVLLVVTQPPGRHLVAFLRSSWIEIAAAC
jgi:hypothetical protein